MMRNREIWMLALFSLAVSAARIGAVWAVSPLAAAVCAGAFALLLAGYGAFTAWRYCQLRRLTEYLAAVYAGGPVLDIRDNTEGELSILKNDLASYRDEMAIPSDFSTSDRDRLVASARDAAASISSRVAYVDEGAYPERRTLEDLNEDDAWASALRSLDEKIATVAPPQDPIGFIDGVGGADSLDEPDNLELDTAFIPFRAPGGHPEVVDTETYVDYLIEDEFSKNSSTAVRRSPRRFLRILEGGTQPNSRHLADTAPSRGGRGGKHFSMPQAAEA